MFSALPEKYVMMVLLYLKKYHSISFPVQVEVIKVMDGLMPRWCSSVGGASERFQSGAILLTDVGSYPERDHLVMPRHWS